MTIRLLSVVAVGIVGMMSCVHAEFNDCLGIKIEQLQTTEQCEALYDACQAGVEILNEKLKMTESSSYHPVSLVSATTSKLGHANTTSFAMLVQLAPISNCEKKSSASLDEAAHQICTFDMEKMEMYSILTTQTSPTEWSLDGYKHHSLSSDERAQVVKEYEDGHFYGTNFAIGIFDSAPLPQQVNQSDDQNVTKSPVGIFVVLALATVSIGLLFHHRQRLHNGYAPITIMKRGQLQHNKLKGLNHPSASSSRPASAASEEVSLKHETNERFAV